MHPLVQTLAHLFTQNPEEEQQLFAPPATEAQIQDFQQKIGLPLPDSFYDLYRWHNGSAKSAHSYIPLNDGEYLLPLASILSTKQMFDEHEKTGVYKRWEPGVYWNSAWVPFIEIDYWFVKTIDTKGCFGGQAGQILSFDYKSAEDRHIGHASFDKWLETMIALKQQDALLTGVHPDWQEEKVHRWTDPSKERLVGQIYQQINDKDAFSVPLWKYRAKEKPQNPHHSPLRAAIKVGNLTKVKDFIVTQKVGVSEADQYEPELHTPLHLALWERQWEIAIWLVEQGADLTAKNTYGSVPFQYALEGYFQRPVTKELSVEQTHAYILQLIQLMEERGGAVDDRRLLKEAVCNNHTAMVIRCLEKTIDLHTPYSSHFKENFLHLAIRHQANLTIIQLLLNKGIQLTAENKDKKTPIDLLLKKRNFYEKSWFQQVLTTINQQLKQEDKTSIYVVSEFWFKQLTDWFLKEQYETILTHIAQLKSTDFSYYTQYIHLLTLSGLKKHQRAEQLLKEWFTEANNNLDDFMYSYEWDWVFSDEEYFFPRKYTPIILQIMDWAISMGKLDYSYSDYLFSAKIWLLQRDLRMDEIKATYDQWIDQLPKNAHKTITYKAGFLKRYGQPIAAIQTYQQALQQYARTPEQQADVYSSLVPLYLETQQKDKAIAAYQSYLQCLKARNLPKDHTQFARYQQAKLLAQLGRFQEAIVLLKALIHESPTTSYHYTELADIYYEIGEYKKYKACYEQRMHIAPTSISICYNRIGWMYECQGNYEQAISYYKKATQCEDATDARHFYAFYSMGDCWYALKNYEKALTCYQKAAEADENTKKDYMDQLVIEQRFGLVYRQLGDVAKATDYFKQALALYERELATYGDEFDFWYHKAELLFALGQKKEAKEILSMISVYHKKYEQWVKESLIRN